MRIRTGLALLPPAERSGVRHGACQCGDRRSLTPPTGAYWVAYRGESRRSNQGVPDPVSGSVAPLEVSELAHEGCSDIGVDLAVEEERPLGLAQLRRNRVQVLERADGRGLEAE